MSHIFRPYIKVSKAVGVTAYVPPLRKVLEELIFRVKAMLAINNCKKAFWVGNLKNRTLQVRIKFIVCRQVVEAYTSSSKLNVIAHFCQTQRVKKFSRKSRILAERVTNLGIPFRLEKTASRKGKMKPQTRLKT